MADGWKDRLPRSGADPTQDSAAVPNRPAARPHLTHCRVGTRLFSQLATKAIHAQDPAQSRTQQCEIARREVAIAAGAVGSPILLMLSGIAFIVPAMISGNTRG